MATRATTKQINISQAHRQLMSALQNLKNSALEAELLLSLALNKDRVFIISHPEQILNPAERKRLKNLTQKRLAGWSIAVLQGFKYFYGLKFKVTRDVLVPRPETELIIDKILESKPKNNLIIDIGTGSGCIITSLAKKLGDLKLKNKYLASDISPRALKVAIQNANNNRVAKKIKFVRGNLLEPLKKEINNFINQKSPLTKEIIIIANLPYLSDKQIKVEPSIKREPRLALFGGNINGTKLYWKLIQEISFLTKQTAKKISNSTKNLTNLTIILEIDPSQEKILSQFIKDKTSLKNIKTIKDLNKRKRFIFCKN